MIVVDFTSHFKRNVRQLSRRYRSIREDIDPLIEQLKAGETPGDQISGVGYTVYKARVKNSDNRKGKSGGYRILYYVVTETHITLVTVYSKSDQSDIDSGQIQRIIREYDQSQ